MRHQHLNNASTQQYITNNSTIHHQQLNNTSPTYTLLRAHTHALSHAHLWDTLPPLTNMSPTPYQHVTNMSPSPTPYPHVINTVTTRHQHLPTRHQHLNDTSPTPYPHVINTVTTRHQHHGTSTPPSYTRMVTPTPLPLVWTL